LDIANWTTDEVVRLFRTRLEGTFFGEEFERVYGLMGDISQWVVARGLQDVKDDGLGFSIPAGCRLVQGAVRSGNTVFFEEALLGRLSDAQMGVLVAHEILYRLAVEGGRDSSATTRQVVRVLLHRELNRHALRVAVKALGWPLDHFFFLSEGNRYRNRPEIDGFDDEIRVGPVLPERRTFYITMSRGTALAVCDERNTCLLRPHPWADPNLPPFGGDGSFLRLVGRCGIEHHQWYPSLGFHKYLYRRTDCPREGS
jgi:hypothetical protein